MAASVIATAAEARPVPRERPTASVPVARPDGSLPAVAAAPLPRRKPDAAVTGSLPESDREAGHDQEAECLAQAIYFEARSEPLEGQFAVARVILNRTVDRRFPDTICGVVYQDAEHKHRCHFSFACDGLPEKPDDSTAWAVARGMAEALIRMDQPGLAHRVMAATHYHADYVAPWWAAKLRMAGQVGGHIFYVGARQGGQTKHASTGGSASH